MIMTEEEMDEQIELMQNETDYQYADEGTEGMNEKELFDALAENCPNELKKHNAKIRADAIEEVKSKMISFHTDAIFQYGADIIEAKSDAFDELKDWLKEQNNG